MTLNEFSALDIEKKFIVMWDGVFIGYREHGGMRLALYNLGDFFVEVYYDLEKNRITRLKPFKERGLLEPYINQVSLSDIDELLYNRL